VTFTSKAKHEREVATQRATNRNWWGSKGVPGTPTAGAPYRLILHWLGFGELKIWFRNRPARLGLYGVPPLWTALGMEIAMLAVDARGLVLCSACGRLDTVKKPGRPGTRSYWRECRKKKRVRDSTRDLRLRQRMIKDLHSQGRSITEIAEELGLSRERVKLYLAKERENGTQTRSD
jgi:DNA-binding CsgD family transcriptional regulator